MIRTLVFVALCGSAAIHANAAPQESQDSISGVINLDLSDPEQRYVMKRSENFNVAASKSRAEAAERDGNYAEAFHHYWATCDAGLSGTCLQAAMLAHTNVVEQVPGVVIKMLYESACDGGIKTACRIADTWTNPVP